MKFGWHDGGEEGEQRGVGYVEISLIFAKHDVLLFETKKKDQVF